MWHREMLIATLFRTSIKLQSHMDRRFRRWGMTAQEASVLLRIVEARRITPGDLAHSLGRDKGKVTRFIQRLVARNLIRRKVKPQDRRSAELEPTSRGRALASRLRVVFDENRDDLFREVPAERVEQVAEILIALLANLECGAPRRRGRKKRTGREAKSKPYARNLQTICNTAAKAVHGGTVSGLSSDVA
jgi:DNA-binding MarR family transcriptional regulator